MVLFCSGNRGKKWEENLHTGYSPYVEVYGDSEDVALVVGYLQRSTGMLENFTQL